MASHTLTAVNDVAWTRANGALNVSVTGGTTFTVQVLRSFSDADAHADAFEIGEQTDTERSALYDIRGQSWVGVKLTAVAGGPVTAHITG